MQLFVTPASLITQFFNHWMFDAHNNETALYNLDFRRCRNRSDFTPSHDSVFSYFPLHSFSKPKRWHLSLQIPETTLKEEWNLKKKKKKNNSEYRVLSHAETFCHRGPTNVRPPFWVYNAHTHFQAVLTFQATGPPRHVEVCGPINVSWRASAPLIVTQQRYAQSPGRCNFLPFASHKVLLLLFFKSPLGFWELQFQHPARERAEMCGINADLPNKGEYHHFISAFRLLLDLEMRSSMCERVISV